MKNINNVKLIPSNTNKYKKIRETLIRINSDLVRINSQNKIHEYGPFTLSKEDAAKYAEKFHVDSTWNHNVSSLSKHLGYKMNKEDIRYPWWNDITMVLDSSSMDAPNLKSAYSHSYFSQTVLKDQQSLKPLSIIGITQTSDDYFVLGRKSGAYNGKLIFVPSGALTFNASPDIDLEKVITKQYLEELNTEVDVNEVGYCGVVEDKSFGKNCLFVVKTKIPLPANKLEKLWRGCEGDFEFLNMQYIKAKDLAKFESAMLPPTKLCLEFISSSPVN